MESIQTTSDPKIYKLSCDEPHMSFTRDGLEIDFKQGDELVVSDSEDVRPGLVLVSTSMGIRLCRYELNNGSGSLLPPLNDLYQSCLILGQVVEHIRLNRRMTF